MGNREKHPHHRSQAFTFFFLFFKYIFIYVHPKQRACGESEQRLCSLFVELQTCSWLVAIKDLQRNLLQHFRLLEADTSRIRKPCLWSFLHGFWLMTFNPWDNIIKKEKKTDIWSFGNEHRRRLNLNHHCLASTGLQLLTKPLRTKISE